VKSPVTITSIASGGDGVGRLSDGQVIFVPRAALGDVLTVDVKVSKARYARGRIAEVVSPGPDRVSPKCPHYTEDDCGGCQLQHVAAEMQREIKKTIVNDALQRIGGLEVRVAEVEPSPHDWRYRGKISLASKRGTIGMRPFDLPDSVFELDDCLLAKDPVMRLWGAVRGNRALLPPETDNLVLRVDRTGATHVLVSASADPWDGEPLLAALADDTMSIWWKPQNGAARVVAGSKTGYPAVAFEQVNLELAAAIRSELVEFLGDVDGKVVWDLYGGVGDTAELLGRQGARVWTVDSDKAAVEWGRKRAELDSTPAASVTRLAERVEDCAGRLPEPDLIVANPPRAGLAKRLVKWLQGWGGKRAGVRLAYVSCDPATLARDLKDMQAFGVLMIKSYDMFPQTAHVETLTCLEAA